MHTIELSDEDLQLLHAALHSYLDDFGHEEADVLRLVKALRPIPKAISKDIDSLNALRNGLAHAFFPENLRKSKPTWKGKNIYSLDGAKLFMDDMRKVSDFFVGSAADVDRL